MEQKPIVLTITLSSSMSTSQINENTIILGDIKYFVQKLSKTYGRLATVNLVTPRRDQLPISLSIFSRKNPEKEKLKPLSIERDGITYDVAHEFIEASRNPGIGAHLRGQASIKKGYLSVNGVKKIA